MTVTVYLHFGLHKTGTTFLQNVLRDNDDLLRRQGFLFPETGRSLNPYASAPQAFSGHARLATLFKRSTSPIGAAQAAALTREVEAASPRAVILSAETLSHPNFDIDAADFSALEAIGTIVPLVYLRRQDRYISSLWREMLGWASLRLTQPLPQFIAQRGESWLDYDARLAPWFRRFGQDQVIVRSYDDVARGDGLLADFCATIGLADAPRVDAADPSYGYPSFTPAITNMLRAVNQRDDLTPDRKAEISYGLKTRPRWQPRDNEADASLLNPEEWKSLADRYRDMNDRLARDVIRGPSDRFLFPQTVPDLRPVKPRFTVKKAMELSLNIWPPEPPDDAPLPEWTPRPPAATPGRNRIAIASLQRQAPDETRAFVAYHLNLGVDLVWLFLDDPDDPVASDFADHPRVRVTRCTSAFWQARTGGRSDILSTRIVAIYEHAARTAFAEGIDWIACIDCDELVFGDLDRAIAEVPDGTQVIRLLPMEASLHDDMAGDGMFSSRVFKRLPGRTFGAIKAARKAHSDPKTPTQFGFFGHTEGKALLHRSARVDCFRHHIPCHTARDVPTAIAGSAVLLHFDSPRFDTWVEKWRLRRQEDYVPTDMSRRRLDQFEEIRKAFQCGDPDAPRRLHRDWYFISAPKFAKLKEIGLIARLDIPERAFLWPVPE